MIIIVNNGDGADKISAIIRGKNEITEPKKIPKADGYIISDGKLNSSHQKIIEKFLKTNKKPVLGIGLGGAYVASVFGSKIKTVKSSASEKVSIKKPCPLLLDFKKIFSVSRNTKYNIDDIPEGFSIAASSKNCDFEIIQHMEDPIFGIFFNPESGGDGIKILRNFEKFMEIWEKYHN